MHAPPLHVLVVDDSPEDRLTVRRYLTRSPFATYIVSEADNGERALAAYQLTHPDCVLLDYRLPDTDGMAVLAALRIQSDVPVVLLTGLGNETLAVEAFRHGAQEYLVKGTLTPERLHLTIQHATTTVRLARERDDTLALLTTVLNTLPLGVTVLDPELRIIQANTTLTRLLDRSAATLRGQPLPALWPELATLLAPYCAQVLTTGQPVLAYEVQVSIPGAPAKYRVWQTSLHPLILPSTATPGLCLTIEDVTVRRQTEAALRTSTTKLYSALESMTDAIVISDLDGRFIDFNEAFATFHKFKHKDECAKTLAEYPAFLEVFLPNGTLAPLEQWAVPRALRGETVTNAEYTLRRKDTGETWVGSYSFAPIRDQAGTIVGSVVVGRDITERKQAEADLRTSTAQLQALSRRLVEAHERERRAIARELHDEVGQVLTGLKLTITTALTATSSSLAATLENVQLAIIELMNRVRSLSLDLRPALIDDMGLLPALNWYLERYTARTGVHVDLRTQGANQRFSPEVEIVAYRLIQEALTNIARYAGVPTAMVRLRADATRLMVRVDDTGCGFDYAAVLAARATAGLSGMHERVQLIGGQLTIESAPGQGTQIIAELPLFIAEPV